MNNIARLTVSDTDRDSLLCVRRTLDVREQRQKDRLALDAVAITKRASPVVKSMSSAAAAIIAAIVRKQRFRNSADFTSSVFVARFESERGSRRNLFSDWQRS